MRAILLLAMIAASAVLTVAARTRDARRATYLFKPLTTLLILSLALQAPGAPGAYQALIAIGLAFSLAGDVLLMLPSNRFVAGLVSFLVAHLWYLAAFVSVDGFGLSLLALPCAAYFAVLLAILLPHTGRMKLPVIAYGLAIVAMAWQALERGARAQTTGAWLAAAGAVLFVVSDSVLAYNRFVRGFRAAHAVVLGTYYLGQSLIALSVSY
jgi:uncharacterized membrane protein YhhN